MRLRALSLLSVVYVLFVLYGSLSPFDLRADPSLAADNFRRAFSMWPCGPAHASRADILANLALYVPLGALAALYVALRRGRRGLVLLAAFDLALATSLTVEGFQLLSLSRVAQATDLLSNTAGGLIGGALGLAFGPVRYLRALRAARRAFTRRPLALATAALALVLLGAAVYPFLPTQDVAHVYRSLRDGRYDLAAGLAARPWHAWLAVAGAFAALAALWGAARRAAARRFLGAAVRATAFAAALQAARIFFLPLESVSRRSANPVNLAAVLVAAVGGALGAIGAAALAGRLSAPAKRTLAVAVILAYVLYAEWTAPPAAAQPAFWWVPFHELADSPTATTIRPLLARLVLAAALTVALRWRRPPDRPPGDLLVWGVLAAALGAALQAARWLLFGASASLSAVACFALGGWLGAVLAGPIACALIRPRHPYRGTNRSE